MLKTNLYTNITRGFQDSFQYKKEVSYYNIKGRDIRNASEILISSNFHNVIRGDNGFGAKPKVSIRQLVHCTRHVRALPYASLFLPVSVAVHLFIHSFASVICLSFSILFCVFLLSFIFSSLFIPLSLF